MIANAENAQNLIETLTVISILCVVFMVVGFLLFALGMAVTLNNRYNDRVVISEDPKKGSFEDISSVTSSTEYKTMLALQRSRDSEIFENTKDL